MKKILICLLCMFICVLAKAATETIKWYVDGNTYATTTCQTGGDITLPPAPTKYGYTFRGWLDYVFLEYIESTGTQYIDTGVVPTKDTKIDTTIGETTSLATGDNGIFGNNDFGARWETVDGLRCGFGTSSWQTTNVTQQAQNKIIFEQNNFKYNNTTLTVGVSNSFTNLTMCLFAHRSNATTVHPSKTRVYYFKVYDTSVLVRNFIPCKDPNGVVGMYDTVTDTFFTNAGTGEFIAGPVINQ